MSDIRIGDLVRYPGLPDWVGKVKEAHEHSLGVEFSGGGSLRTVLRSHTEAVVWCECCDGTGYVAKYKRRRRRR